MPFVERAIKYVSSYDKVHQDVAIEYEYVPCQIDCGGQPNRSRMRTRFASMTVALAVGVTAAAVVACATASWIYSAHHFDALLATARSTALAESE